MLDLTKFECSGCTACYNACPTKAIDMIENKEGFKEPKVDTQKCIRCGLCDKVCVMQNSHNKSGKEPLVYGVKNKNIDERKQSQSGGAFYILAKRTLEENGVVYGAILDVDFVVRHTRAETIDETQRMQGSKYVQSDLGDTFLSVRDDLDLNKRVLFSGTPCQVAGLKAFLKKDYENLLTVDLICHGVPSPKVWRDYVQWQRKRFKRKQIRAFNFRDKSRGWGPHFESFFVNNTKKSYCIYTQIFYGHKSMRKSCYVCPFTSKYRVADFTIGDFWGIERINPNFKDQYGVSVILVNTEKAESKWHDLAVEFDAFTARFEDVLERNPCLSKPFKKPEEREKFWLDYDKGFSLLAKKHGGWTFKGKLKTIVKRMLKRI